MIMSLGALDKFRHGGAKQMAAILWVLEAIGVHLEEFLVVTCRSGLHPRY